MAKPQVSRSFWKRFGGWCRRHKVKAAFSLLLVLIVLVAVEGWIQTQISIRFERQRFQAAEKQVYRMGNDVDASFPGAKTMKDSECTSQTAGGIFDQPFITCDTTVGLSYVKVDRQQALEKSKAAANVLKKSVEIRKIRDSQGYLVNDEFKVGSIDCLLVAQYYDNVSQPYQRDSLALNEANTLFIEVSCGGAAQRPYFPVKQS